MTPGRGHSGTSARRSSYGGRCDSQSGDDFRFRLKGAATGAVRRVASRCRFHAQTVRFAHAARDRPER
jgi:hypothetical protein